MDINIEEFLNGWTNLVKKKLGNVEPELLKLSEERILICKKCEIFTGKRCDNRRTTLNIKTNEQVKGCGCVLVAKTICENCACPAAKW